MLRARLLRFYECVEYPDSQLTDVAASRAERAVQVDSEFRHVPASELRGRDRERVQLPVPVVRGKGRDRLWSNANRHLLWRVEEVGTGVEFQIKRRVLLGI